MNRILGFMGISHPFNSHLNIKRMKYAIYHVTKEGKHRLDGFTNEHMYVNHPDGSLTQTLILEECSHLYIQMDGNMNLHVMLEPSCGPDGTPESAYNNEGPDEDYDGDVHDTDLDAFEQRF